jgi:uncharacterized protein
VGDEIKKETSGENTGSIRRSSRTRSRKPKKNQIIPGIFILLGVIVLGIVLAVIKPMLGFFWMTGNIFGFILQRSRFCFTASLRDPYLTGGTNLTKAVLTAFAITSIGFIAIQYGAVSKGLPMPGQAYVVPISAATAIGAFIFGIGMVISGGCASGTCMRVGEGFQMQMLSLLFFVVGSLWGAHDFGWWKLNVILKGKAVYLPDVFGWTGAVVIQLLTIALLWIAADKWGKFKAAQSN